VKYRKYFLCFKKGKDKKEETRQKKNDPSAGGKEFKNGREEKRLKINMNIWVL
jgi:hypothetical protein